MSRRKDPSSSRVDLQSQVAGIPSRLVSRKVKLQLVQPDTVCAERRRVKWYGLGTIIIEHPRYYIVEFKSKGFKISSFYDRENCYFIDEKYRDLKLIEL